MVSRPYALLARFYDQLMPGVPEMNRHARQKILGKILPKVQSVCDLGCGTGATAVDFAQKGKKVYAVDVSSGMCAVARDRLRQNGVAGRVLHGDMRNFRLPQPVDLVTCEFAAINHLTRKSELGRVFHSVWRALNPGGFFYFDLNSELAFAPLPEMTHCFESTEFLCVLRGQLDKRRGIGTVTLDWFLPMGTFWRRHKERIPHIWWSDAEIRRDLKAAGFRNIRFFDGVQVRPPSPVNHRGYDLYYLSQK